MDHYFLTQSLEASYYRGYLTLCIYLCHYDGYESKDDVDLRYCLSHSLPLCFLRSGFGKVLLCSVLNNTEENHMNTRLSSLVGMND